MARETLKNLLKQLQDIGDYHLAFLTQDQREESAFFFGLQELSLDANLSAPLQAICLLTDLQFALRHTHDPKFDTMIKKIVNEHPLFSRYKQSDDTNLIKYFKNLALEIGARHKEALIEYNENPKFTKLQRFETGEKLNPTKGFTHSTRITHKKILHGEKSRDKNKKAWYRKWCPDKTTALREVIAQEFFRLLLPQQQKTRLAKDDEGRVYVMSKESNNALQMSKIPRTELRDKINDGTFKGLASVLMINEFMHETDAKLENMLVDEDGRVIKIDGDWSLSGLRDPNQFSLNYRVEPINIEDFPITLPYVPYNWLDVYNAGKPNLDYFNGSPQHPTILDHNIAEKVFFRAEMNETLMKIITLPKELVKKFVSSYTNNSEEMDLITEELNKRIVQFRQSSLENDNFWQYLATPAARKDFKKHLEALTDFTTSKKNHLLTDDLAEVMKKKFQELVSPASTLTFRQKEPAKTILAPKSLNKHEESLSDDFETFGSSFSEFPSTHEKQESATIWNYKGVEITSFQSEPTTPIASKPSKRTVLPPINPQGKLPHVQENNFMHPEKNPVKEEAVSKAKNDAQAIGKLGFMNKGKLTLPPINNNEGEKKIVTPESEVRKLKRY